MAKKLIFAANAHRRALVGCGICPPNCMLGSVQHYRKTLEERHKVLPAYSHTEERVCSLYGRQDDEPGKATLA
jgi:hypothetical protein